QDNREQVTGHLDDCARTACGDEPLAVALGRVTTGAPLGFGTCGLVVAAGPVLVRGILPRCVGAVGVIAGHPGSLVTVLWIRRCHVLSVTVRARLGSDRE